MLAPGGAPGFVTLQGRVRSLLRRALRAMPTESERALVRDAFREHMDVPRKSFDRIEYLLRKGERQLKVLEGGGRVVARVGGRTTTTRTTRTTTTTRPGQK